MTLITRKLAAQLRKLSGFGRSQRKYRINLQPRQGKRARRTSWVSPEHLVALLDFNFARKAEVWQVRLATGLRLG